MQAPSGDQRITTPSSRLHELGLVLPTPPTPLTAYVESSDAAKRHSRGKEQNYHR
jgi:hypothetical protein